jgi:hypothetical protein
LPLLFTEVQWLCVTALYYVSCFVLCCAEWEQGQVAGARGTVVSYQQQLSSSGQRSAGLPSVVRQLLL